MAIATGRTVLTGLILSLGVLFRPGTAESCSPVEQPGARTDDPSGQHERARGGHQFVPPGVLATVLFARISDRMCGFLGYFLPNDFARGEVTLNRLVERFRATLDDSL